MADRETTLDIQLQLIKSAPMHGILVRPEDNNTLWHFLLWGLPATPFEGGIYYGQLSFPPEFPHVAPTVTFFTPNGTLQTHVPIKILNDRWSPSTTLAETLISLRSLMMSTHADTGFVADYATKIALARSSMDFNRADKNFNTAFGEILRQQQQSALTNESIAALQRIYATRSRGRSSLINSVEGFNPVPKHLSATNSSDLFVDPLVQQQSHQVLPIPVPAASSTQQPRPTSNGITTSATMSASIPSASTLAVPITDSGLSSSGQKHSSSTSPTHSPSLGGSGERSPSNSTIEDDEVADDSAAASAAVRAPRRPSVIVRPAPAAQSQFGQLDTEDGTKKIHDRIYATLRPEVSTLVNAPNDANLTLPEANILSFHRGPPFPGPSTDEERQMTFCKVRVDFTSWKYLQPANLPGQASGEEQREAAKEIVVKILDKIMAVLWAEFKIRVSFSEINLSDTEASMRAVFQGKAPNGSTVHRESELEVLDLSITRTSPRSLLSLYRLVNLKDLYLDYCPSIQKSGKHVFSLLLKKDPIPSLETLSVVGTSQVMSHQWLSEVESRCPKLKRVFFTRKIGTKALGWHDVIMMQTMRDPQLMPCGHIGDRSSLLSMGYCGFDRVPFKIEEILPINPAITSISKDETGKWAATVVDILRDPLDGKCLYHVTCGQFMNFTSIQRLFDLDSSWQSLDERLVSWLADKKCTSCTSVLNNLRICYPHTAEPTEKHFFDDLKQLGSYGVEFDGTRGSSSGGKRSGAFV